jgi:hypothetical protein
MSSVGSIEAPSHCSLVPIFSGEQAAAVRICAVIQKADTGVGSSLVLLSSGWMGRAYLGALTDSRQTVLGWLELWVQMAGGETVLDESEAGTNPELDMRWKRWVSSMANGVDIIATNAEATHPLPVWLDVAAGRTVTPMDVGSGQPYELCQDDAALLVGGLDCFSESRRRFLAVKGQPSAGFIAATGEAAGNSRSVNEVLPNGGKGLLAFNPEGGFIFVRRLAPLEWEQHAGLLSGRAWRGLAAGRPPVKLGGPYAALDDWDRLQQGGAHLFSGSRGRAGRFHETFHLKLQLFLSMVRVVRARVAGTQLPQLNLTPSCFRVDLSPAAGALPVLWTAQAVLVEPPVSVALTAPGDLKYFKPAVGFGSSIYRSEGAGRALRGRGELRVRKVTVAADRMLVEATLVSPEVSPASPRDIVWARLPLSGVGAVNLVGTIDAADALAQGEARFRTAPMEPGQILLNALRAAEGGVFPGTPFETIPLLSSPVDLYSLGVLGVQLFLTGGGKPLPTALDEVLSLARATQNGAGTPGEKVRALVTADVRWLQSLGPQHHGHGFSTPEEASALLPLELWWDVVAMLGRLFPGSGENAFCRDFGDAPPYKIDAIFDPVVAAVEAIALRSQSLLLCDWPTNREVAHVIQKVR